VGLPSGEGDAVPYVVIRHYKDAPKLIEKIRPRLDDVANLIRGIPGFLAFNLVRSERGAVSVSVYEDRAGAEESVRVAREYLQKNLPGVSGPPEIIQGEAVLSIRSAGP
jgi:hypothetical protein